MLKIEDVKAGDELVCIDRDGFTKSSGNHNHVHSFIVSRVGNGELIIGDGLWCIYDRELKYFKKKEQSQYTFDDLIDVAVQAVKDGLIACDDFKRFSISFSVAWNEDDGYEVASHHDAKYFNEAIDFIQSLYKETFVIESEEDLKRIKKGADITLSNSNKSKVSVIDYDENTLKVANWDYFLQFFSLKGATVEQERGRDD